MRDMGAKPVRVMAAVLLAIVAIAAGPRPSAAQSAATSGADVLRRFERAVAEYAALHRKAAGQITPPQVARNMAPAIASSDLLAERIRAARRQARQGDIFSAEAAVVFRRHIAGAVTREEVADLLVDRDDGTPIRRPQPRVNARWPLEVEYVYVPPRLIAALPPLPPELQYRLIGRSLVLWDRPANLIVDVLPEAL